ncbi:hypothetical protein MMC25_007313 [Agyrium rufum]|nr:hypothetical protein [Agyrium rufum]
MSLASSQATETSLESDKDFAVPEKIFDEWSPPAPQGYAQSKFVYERMLAEASRVVNIPSAICRVGQIAGPTTEKGAWNKQEWLPTIIASSKAMGVLPTDLGMMDRADWVPIDVLAKVVVELIMNSADDWVKRTQSHMAVWLAEKGAAHIGNTPPESPTEKALPTSDPYVFSAINPKARRWAPGLLDVTIEYFNNARTPEQHLKAVPLTEWVECLREKSKQPNLSEKDYATNPALKLVDFFESLVSPPLTMATEETVYWSPTLRNLAPVKREWMEGWLRQWAF